MTTLRPPITIRPAVPSADFAGVLAVYAANDWSHANQPERLRVAVERADLGLVAVEEGRIVGYVRTLSDGAFAVYIADILVLPSHQRRGIGGDLMREVFARYPLGHFHHQVLMAERGAEGFYRRLGLAPVGGFGLTAFIRTRNS